ncbi:MAG: hypothetical protein HYX96_08135 [Chloroflexi bacterium]|nr:hypothetical protein [Chloroflexota bacterium]
MNKNITARKFRLSSILALLAAGIVLAAGCSQGVRPPEATTAKPAPPAYTTPAGAPGTGSLGQPAETTQESNGGEVTIIVTWEGPRDGGLAMDVTMNTHSVNLDNYDLGKLAAVRYGPGSEYRPVSWNAPAGGHHRRGTLVLPLPPASDGVSTVELVIRNVGGIKERVLSWALTS